MSERLHLHSPSGFKRLLERMGLREVKPSDICGLPEIEPFYNKYPDLRGDRTAIGPGDDGHCQSWRDNPGWWKELVIRESKL